MERASAAAQLEPRLRGNLSALKLLFTMAVLYGPLLVSFVYARVPRRTKPHVYTRIGRQ